MDFRNADDVFLVQRGSEGTRGIVFIRCGKNRPLIANIELFRKFDLSLIFSFYAKPEFDIPEGATVLSGGLSKLHAFKHAYLKGYISTYAPAYALFDPDIVTTIGDISTAIDFIAPISAPAICQPSLTPESKTYWEFLKQSKRRGFRRTNFCEVMCPVFNARAIKTSLWTFDISESTWGIDYLWQRCVPHGQMFILDRFAVTHNDDVDVANGPFYKYLASRGIDPFAELKRITEDFALTRFKPRQLTLLDNLGALLKREARLGGESGLITSPKLSKTAAIRPNN